MVFELSSGLRVILEALHVTRTYGGLLEGLPTQRMNNEILATLPSRMTPLWGKRKTHIVPPSPHEKHGGIFLPKLIYLAWLSSLGAIHSDFIYSELVIVWFGAEQLDTPLQSLVSEAIRNVPWEDLAEPCDP